MDVTLSEAFTYLLGARQKNFYARVVSALKGHVVPGFPTLAVGITADGAYGFFYDPEHIKKMSLQELVLACEHEVIHLLNEHIPRYLNLVTNIHGKEAREFQRKVMNIAADIAVNELIRQEPNFDTKWGKHFYGSDETEGRDFLIAEPFHLANQRSFEEYRNRILERMTTFTPENERDGKSGRGVAYDFKVSGTTATKIEIMPGVWAPLDEAREFIFLHDKSEQPYFPVEMHRPTHEFWLGISKDPNQKEGDPLPGDGGTKNDEELQALAESLKNEGRNLIRQAVEEHSRSRGTIPSTIKELVQAYLTPPVIPWPQVLRSLVTRTRQQKVSRGMTRPSRRLHGVPGILPFPGKSRDNRFTILCALDSSGSMNTKELREGLQQGIMDVVQTEPDVHLIVLYCDAALNVEYDVRSLGDIQLNVGGRGGTDFNPVFIRARELLRSTERAPDVMIYITDGGAPAPEPENRVPIPVIWLLTPRGSNPSPDYGIHLRMKDQ